MTICQITMYRAIANPDSPIESGTIGPNEHVAVICRIMSAM